MKNKWFIGKKKSGLSKGFWFLVQSEKEPTEETHGGEYTICEGPFQNKENALERCYFWNGELCSAAK